MNFEELFKFYNELRKDRPSRYLSPVEVILRIIEHNIKTKSFVRIMLTRDDLKNLRRLQFLEFLELKNIKEYTIFQDENWIRNYIRRKNPQLYKDIMIFSRQDIIFINSKGLEVPESLLKK